MPRLLYHGGLITSNVYVNLASSWFEHTQCNEIVLFLSQAVLQQGELLH